MCEWSQPDAARQETYISLDIIILCKINNHQMELNSRSLNSPGGKRPVKRTVNKHCNISMVYPTLTCSQISTPRMGTCAGTSPSVPMTTCPRQSDIQINGSWFAVVTISSFFVVGVYPYEFACQYTHHSVFLCVIH